MTKCIILLFALTMQHFLIQINTSLQVVKKNPKLYKIQNLRWLMHVTNKYYYVSLNKCFSFKMLQGLLIIIICNMGFR